MAIELPAGKWRRLRSLTDEQGRFKMMAIDQRGSLRRAIAKAASKDTQKVAYEDLAKAKEIVTKVLAPHATAVLTDPVYGYPYSIQHLPSRVGLLLAYEESDYEKAGPTGRERKTRLIENWSADKAGRTGADAIKLLIYYHPNASQAVCHHQQELVQRVGEECERVDLPFLLELVSYALDGDSTDTLAFARSKPDLVTRSATEFSRPKYKVDILKLEFPADLKWSREFSQGAFDGRERQAAYSLSEVREFCCQLGGATGVPWVILSAGVDIEEFLVQVDLATEAGASGFLCGRAIWKDAIDLYPNIAQMEEWLRTQGAYNFVRANAYAGRALPWFCHRRFGGPQHVELAQRSPRWYAEYRRGGRL